MTTLVWFRRDLRLRDNPALDAACKAADSILPLFVYSPEEEAPWEPGSASRWYLHQSLHALHQDLRQHGLDLVTSRGPSTETLLSFARLTGATHVFWNRVYEPALLARDEVVAEALRSAGLKVQIFHDHSLLPPGQITNASGNLYRVFTPYWRRLASVMAETANKAGLSSAAVSDHQSATVAHQSISALELLDDHPWHDKLGNYWQPGEAAAIQHLDSFLDKLNGYAEGRNFPARDATSRLSAALHFGELSPWRIVHALRPFYEGEQGKEAALNAESMMRQLGWREFAINLLRMAPDSTDYSLQKKFEDSGIWFHDPERIEQWQRGNTGFSLVDAGMSELWETGYMHNRVRMVAASMLTKNLGQHWIHGARWFWDTLVDADLANNTMGWQWVAGCGCDAAPYYRVFNPETQAKRFDPQGLYISRWLDATQLTTPIVDLASSREAALSRYAQISK